METIEKYAPPIAKKGEGIKLEQSINFRKFLKQPLLSVVFAGLCSFLNILPCGEGILTVVLVVLSSISYYLTHSRHGLANC